MKSLLQPLIVQSTRKLKDKYSMHTQSRVFFMFSCTIYVNIFFPVFPIVPEDNRKMINKNDNQNKLIIAKELKSLIKSI